MPQEFKLGFSGRYISVVFKSWQFLELFILSSRRKRIRLRCMNNFPNLLWKFAQIRQYQHLLSTTYLLCRKVVNRGLYVLMDNRAGRTTVLWYSPIQLTNSTPRTNVLTMYPFTGDTQMTPIIVESDAWTTGQPTVLNVLPSGSLENRLKWWKWARICEEKSTE